MSVGKHFSSLKTSRFLLFMHALRAPNFDCNDQCLKGVVVVCDSDSMFVMWLFCDEREREREREREMMWFRERIECQQLKGFFFFAGSI